MAPRHGRLHEARRRCIRWLLDRMGWARSPLCAPGALPVCGIHRVLVLRPNHRLGNMLLVTPLIAELERLYPGAEVDILGAGQAPAAIFAHFATVRSVFALHHRIVRHLPATFGLLRTLRRTRYDLIVDAGTGSSSGRILLALLHGRFKVAGHDDKAHAATGRPAHLAWRAVHLLRRAYAGNAASDWPAMDIRLDDTERARGVAMLQRLLSGSAAQGTGKVVALFANATGRKRYDETWWQRFIDALQAGEPDLRFIEVVAAHAQSQLGSRLPTFYSSDLRKMAALIDATDLFISADCGVMHLAATTGTKTIGLFSVTDRDKYSPYGRGNVSLDTSHGDPAEAAQRVLESMRSR